MFKTLLSLIALFGGTSFAQITTCSTTPVVKSPTVTLVQHCGMNSQINLPYTTTKFKNPNIAGHWIGVFIYAGQGSTHTFSITDTLGNTYKQALTAPNTTGVATLGVFYAENIKAGVNTVRVMPDHPGYQRVVIREYSGMALVDSLDVVIAAQGHTATPTTGVVATTVNGDLLTGTAIFADAQSVSPTGGYLADDYIPNPPGTKIVVEDLIQATAGDSSASVKLGSINYWAIGMVAFKVQ